LWSHVFFPYATRTTGSPTTLTLIECSPSRKERTLVLLDHGKILKKYKISLGADPTGLKNRQGDHKTPEGIYILDRRNEHSHFYRSLHISYPNADDRARASKSGVDPGEDIMLHGLPNGFGWLGSTHRLRD